MNKNKFGIIKVIFNDTDNIEIKGKEKTVRVYKDNTTNSFCSCTGNTLETATRMIYNDETECVECPKCGKHSFETIQSLKQYYEKLENDIREQEERIRNTPLMLNEVNYDWETGIHYYALNKRIDYDDWKKVKDCFHYYRYSDWEDLEPTGQRTGWMTRVPKEVEKILGITETLEKREKEQEKKKNEEKKFKSELTEAFNEGVRMKNNRLSDLLENNDAYDDPEWSWEKNSIYGGGRLWIISNNEIYQITNNGTDGGDWSLNNIETGGAGAIGIKVAYSNELHNVIREYGNEYELNRR